MLATVHGFGDIWVLQSTDVSLEPRNPCNFVTLVGQNWLYLL